MHKTKRLTRTSIKRTTRAQSQDLDDTENVAPPLKKSKTNKNCSSSCKTKDLSASQSKHASFSPSTTEKRVLGVHSENILSSPKGSNTEEKRVLGVHSENILSSPKRSNTEEKRVLGVHSENISSSPNSLRGKGGKSFRENQDMRRQLHLGHATLLCCRELEAATVRKFVLHSIDENQSASLYVSGPPGTGKTAVVTMETDKLSAEGRCTVLQINCMRVSSPGQLFCMLLGELKAKKSTVQESRALDELEAVLNKRSVRNPLIIVLDEMDQLGARLKETLYRVFDWVGHLSCRIMVIGIANALDLTDRLLPRLQLREHKPQLLHFPPYTPAQISKIVANRLTRISATSDAEDGVSRASAMDNMALQLCARKVAASSGDVRSALDICRRSLELAEREARRNHCTTPSSPGLSHVSRAIEAARGGGVANDNNLPLQQQMTVAAAMLIRRAGTREWTLGRLHDRYMDLCEERRIGPLDAGEFSGVCQLLEARGVLSLRAAKEIRLAKMTLRMDDRGLEARLSDQPLLKALLTKGDRCTVPKGGKEG